MVLWKNPASVEKSSLQKRHGASQAARMPQRLPPDSLPVSNPQVHVLPKSAYLRNHFSDDTIITQ
jgi:hypothetical protein